MKELKLDPHTNQRQRLAKEMYLKSILQLGNSGEGKVRPVDLVNCLGVTKGSVSEMVKKLNEEGLLEYESFKYIKLTTKGRRRANLILKKYHIIRLFLEDVLKVNPSIVHDEACNLEHVFSEESVAKLDEFLKKNR